MLIGNYSLRDHLTFWFSNKYAWCPRSNAHYISACSFASKWPSTHYLKIYIYSFIDGCYLYVFALFWYSPKLLIFITFKILLRNCRCIRYLTCHQSAWISIFRYKCWRQAHFDLFEKNIQLQVNC